jgi:hypothetical protein
MGRFKDFLILAIVAGVIVGIVAWIYTENVNAFTGFLYFVVTLVVSVLVSLFQTKLGLAAADRDQRSFAELRGEAMTKLGPYIGWTLLAGLIISVGVVLCVLPGLIAAFFLLFVPFLAIEMNRGGLNPLVGSFNAVKERAGSLILLFLVFVAIAIGVGILGLVLGFIPLIGPIVAAIVQFVLFGFALCTVAVVFRSSAVGRAGT